MVQIAPVASAFGLKFCVRPDAFQRRFATSDGPVHDVVLQEKNQHHQEYFWAFYSRAAFERLRAYDSVRYTAAGSRRGVETTRGPSRARCACSAQRTTAYSRGAARASTTVVHAKKGCVHDLRAKRCSWTPAVLVPNTAAVTRRRAHAAVAHRADRIDTKARQ